MSKAFFSLICFSFAIISGFALGEDPFPSQIEETPPPELLEFPPPWFTGPLLTPAGHVVPAGYINVEPYTFVNIINGKYDDDWDSFSEPNCYNVNFQFPLFVGLTHWMNLLVVPQASWNGTQGISSLVFNDFIAELDMQLIEDTKNNTLPGLKLYVQEIFPSGHYEKRDPEKLGTDIGGKGTYKTTAGFVLTRLFHIYDLHYLSLRFNGLYSIPSNVSVRGVNAYGGAPDTRGTVKPGQSIGGLFGMEYSFSQNWAFACDVFSVYTKKTKFSGNPGIDPDGSPAVVGGPSSFQFSLAPAFEYNFSSSTGIIAGAWFSLAGRNTSRFISAVFAINYFGPFREVEHRFRSSGGGPSPSGAGGGGF